MASKSKRNHNNFKQKNRLNPDPQANAEVILTYTAPVEPITGNASFGSNLKEATTIKKNKYLYKELMWIGIVTGIDLVLLMILYFIFG